MIMLKKYLAEQIVINIDMKFLKFSDSQKGNYVK